MSARLALVGVPEVTVPLPAGQEVRLGRKPTNQFVVDHMMCSSVHCAFVFDGKSVYLTDMSTNGTFVNDSRLVRGAKTPLLNTSIVEIGRLASQKSPYMFRVEVTPPLEPQSSAAGSLGTRGSGELRLLQDALAEKDLEISVWKGRHDSLEQKMRETLENVAQLTYAISQYQRAEQEQTLRLEYATRTNSSLTNELKQSAAKIRQLEESIDDLRLEKTRLNQHLDHVTSTLSSLVSGLGQPFPPPRRLSTPQPYLAHTQIAHFPATATARDEHEHERKSLSQMDVSLDQGEDEEHERDSLFGPNPPEMPNSLLQPASLNHVAPEEDQEAEDDQMRILRRDSEPDNLIDVLQLSSI